MRKHKSELAELLTTLRRIVVLAVAAIELVYSVPYDTLVLRLLTLWAVLILVCGATELLFQYLMQQAQQSEKMLMKSTGAHPTQGSKANGNQPV